MKLLRLTGWFLLFFSMSCQANMSCGNNDNILNTRKGEKVIGHWLEKQGMPSTSVECPKDIQIQKDANFLCQAMLANSEGLTIDIKVSQPADKGDIEMALASKVQVSEVVERGLAGQVLDQTGKKVVVDCGARTRLAVPGATYICALKGKDESFQMKITILEEAPGWQAQRL